MKDLLQYEALVKNSSMEETIKESLLYTNGLYIKQINKYMDDFNINLIGSRQNMKIKEL
tara:strand:+ start:29 stop:205 length:177 start_codon:yes stop_codon:yes gene_type:complete